MQISINNFLSNSNRNYFILMIFLAVSLPLSIFTTSLAEILLVVNWIVEGNFPEKIQKLSQRKAPLIVTAIFALHIIGLLYSNDFNYGFHDLKIKLPILILPIIIGSSAPLDGKQLRSLLLFFSAAVFAASLISSSIFFGLFQSTSHDYRNISIFISHIRFALMINLAIFSLVFYASGGDELPLNNKKLRIALFAVAIWLCCFLIILKSFTGLVIFIALLLFNGWKYSSFIKMLVPRLAVRVVIITIPLLIASYVSRSVAKYYYKDQINFSELEKVTSEGNPYYHSTDSHWTENGHYVWIYICEQEMRKEWEKRSSLKYDGKDKLGQDLRYTLIRYLSSKGYRKDASGIKQMTEKDIMAVENGVANYIFLDRFSLYPRIYQIVWELDNYRHGGDPSGHSIAQRLAYLKAATHIIGSNFLIGVGTGDVQQEFNRYYESSKVYLQKESRRRAHNQFVTFFIAFGLIGFLVCCIALLYPVFIEKRWSDYLFICFAIIAFLSMINEDTLETQTGVSFFMFFYSLFLFGRLNGVKPDEPGVIQKHEIET